MRLIRVSIDSYFNVDRKIYFELIDIILSQWTAYPIPIPYISLILSNNKLLK